MSDNYKCKVCDGRLDARAVTADGSVVCTVCGATNAVRMDLEEKSRSEASGEPVRSDMDVTSGSAVLVPPGFDLSAESPQDLNRLSKGLAEGIRFLAVKKLLRAAGIAVLAVFFAVIGGDPFTRFISLFVPGAARAIVIGILVILGLAAAASVASAFVSLQMLRNPPKAGETPEATMESFLSGVTDDYGNLPRSWSCLTTWARAAFYDYDDFESRWRLFVGARSRVDVKGEHREAPFFVESVRRLHVEAPFCAVQAVVKSTITSWATTRTLVEVAGRWYLLDGRPYEGMRGNGYVWPAS